MDSDLIELENNFIELHKVQLKSCGLPDKYWINLFHKLKDEVKSAFFFLNSPIFLLIHGYAINLRFLMRAPTFKFVLELTRMTKSWVIERFMPAIKN
jgi:hypothetical protein